MRFWMPALFTSTFRAGNSVVAQRTSSWRCPAVGYVGHWRVMQAGVLLLGFGQLIGAPAHDDDGAAGLQKPDGQGQADARGRHR